MPGSPVRGSRSGAPVMALLDLLGRRWALGIVWILAEVGPLSFNALQVKCESISPGVLNTRLKELIMANLVSPMDRSYKLTDQGLALFSLIAPIGGWARETWAPGLPDGNSTGVPQNDQFRRQYRPKEER